MNRTGYFTHSDCLKHEMGDGHPECPERLEAIDKHLRATGLADQLLQRQAPLADLADVELAHSHHHTQTLRTLTGTVDPKVRYRVRNIETRRTSSKPPGPFITSSLQIAAANQLGFATQRTMRTAQSLYEGVNVPGEGQVGLITYMRTDSTNLSPEAITQIRGYIEAQHGAAYLPEKPNLYSSSNKDAQEAHEAIRPTDVARTPEALRDWYIWYI